MMDFETKIREMDKDILKIKILLSKDLSIQEAFDKAFGQEDPLWTDVKEKKKDERCDKGVEEKLPLSGEASS